MHSKEYLIKILQIFHEEHGRSPKYDEMKVSNGYPSKAKFTKKFGSWNNALKEAGLEINHLMHKLDGTETCFHCGCKKKDHWCYEDEVRYCRSCYDKYDYKYGNLDPNTNVATGFIGEKIVLKTLDSEIHCNCKKSFNHSVDIYDKHVYGKIDVKSAVLREEEERKNGIWGFKLNQVEIPDYYFVLAFTPYYQDIKHVWVIPSEAEILQGKQKIGITNSKIGLSRFKQYEVSPLTFNETYHSMDIENCPVIRS